LCSRDAWSNNTALLLAVFRLLSFVTGEVLFISQRFLHRFCLVKNLTSTRSTPMRKRVETLVCKKAEKKEKRSGSKKHGRLCLFCEGRPYI
jgi:hypothetical protein